MNNALIAKAKKHVITLLEEHTPENNYYHNSEHTKEVVKACGTIAKGLKLSDSNIEIIKLAALFHDLGYLEKIEGHEKISAKYAADFLAKEKYPASKINKVKGCILATKVPQNPKNILEKVLCDADLLHLGKPNFEPRNNMFRAEFEFYFGRALTEKEWLNKSIDFLCHHKFFTEFAIKKYEKRKLKNIAKLKDELNNYLTKKSRSKSVKKNSVKKK